jgi:hypothetical protein
MNRSTNCPRCHRPIPAGVRFCPACGYSLGKRRRIAIALICVALAAGAAVLLAHRHHALAHKGKSLHRSRKAATATAPLDTASLTPEETASLIAVYAGSRHGGDWQKVLTIAKADRLQIILYDAEHFKLANNGEGTAYDVCAGGSSRGTVYTLTASRSTFTAAPTAAAPICSKRRVSPKWPPLSPKQTRTAPSPSWRPP